MPSASATKASDKAQACRKLTALLQKDYKTAMPDVKLPVLETMLFAVCLEDCPWELARTGYDRLQTSYFNLNEVRVSSVGELESTLSDLKDADWKGLRIRSLLRYVFESTYSFDFEKLAKLTMESAQKRLRKIEYLSPFITNFTLQQVLGCHVVCLDSSCHRAAIHLGIVPPDSTITDASDFLKAGVKKSEAAGFAFLLRCLATDPKFEARIADEFDADDDFDVLRVEERLAVLKAPKKKKPPRKAATKTPDKSSAGKTPARKTGAKTTKKAVTKKAATKKPATKKPATKKAAAKKKTGKKTSVKKAAPPRKTAKKKTGTKSAKARKATRKKT